MYQVLVSANIIRGNREISRIFNIGFLKPVPKSFVCTGLRVKKRLLNFDHLQQYDVVLLSNSKAVLLSRSTYQVTFNIGAATHRAQKSIRADGESTDRQGNCRGKSICGLPQHFLLMTCF
jgi:hypothetical protein